MNARKIQKFAEAEPNAKIPKDHISAFAKMVSIMSKVMAVRTRTNVKSLRTIRGRHVDMGTVSIRLEAIHVNANRDIFTKDRALRTTLTQGIPNYIWTPYESPQKIMVRENLNVSKMIVLTTIRT